MHIPLTGKTVAFLSTESVGPRETRAAVAAILLTAAVGLAIAPLAETPLPRAPAFIPIYVSALVVCDLVTSALLLGQFAVLPSRALLVLAAGYLLTAATTVAYAIVFPGLFSASGLLGAGAQTTSALYIFWHAAFPLAVIGYVLLRRRGGDPALHAPAVRGRAHLAIPALAAGVVAVVWAFTWFATVQHERLPVFLVGDRTTDLGRAALAAIWLLSLAALLLLWRQRPRALLDLWLMVVMFVWLADIGVAAVLNTGRYDLGWYAGRIYGLFGASFLLLVLLVGNSRQYALTIRMAAELKTANLSLEHLSNSDALTGLANRRHFDAYLGEQIAVARRHKRQLALVLCDIDEFKSFNDRYGHPAGDGCLRQVAQAIRSCCQRPADLTARYGGEEFAMILPDTDLLGAAHIADAARRAVAALGIRNERASSAPTITISCGVADLPEQPGAAAPNLIAAVDQALYRAKAAGRNRVAIWHP